MSSTTDSSYILPTPPPFEGTPSQADFAATTPHPPSQYTRTASLDSLSEIASLPSESTSASDLDTLSDYSDSDAEAEWQESIEQLELLLTMVLVPFVGKFLGRKCAYWGWTRFMEWKYPLDRLIEEENLGGGKGSSVKAYASL
ncbi:uncharacterized protein BDV14DRAFT_181827 [Aspergillus stella-maris]|uniref:uncharacterized protein n=1 Tax=Aspergillus stella-maris TaxID=1810926 RepID=UPI003CCCDEE3